MGRGVEGEGPEQMFLDGRLIAFDSALGSIEEARARLTQNGWPRVGVHTPEALAAWEDAAGARAERIAQLEMEKEVTSTAFMSGVMAGWSQCLIQSPETYARSLALTTLPKEKISAWFGAADSASYDIHCVLGGSTATFGIEIEFVGDLQKVADALFEVGLATSPKVSDSNRPVGWTVKEDTSVKPAGGEVVSPILVDVPDSWKELDRVCALLKELGAVVNSSCGLHIHYGADRLDDDVANFLRLYLLNRAFEDLLYRLASAGGTRVHRGTGYNEPISKRSYSPYVGSVKAFTTRIEASPFDALNFSNVGTSKNTIEFRYPNGTLDPVQIQALAVLFCGMVEASRRSDLDLYGLELSELGQHWGRPENGSAILTLCDTLFPTNNRAKLQMLWLYQNSSWQQRPLHAPDQAVTQSGRAGIFSQLEVSA